MSIKLICLACKSNLKLDTDKFSIIQCTCGEKYYVVEGIPIMLNDINDFYRYKKIFKRLVSLKNET